MLRNELFEEMIGSEKAHMEILMTMAVGIHLRTTYRTLFNRDILGLV